MIRPTKSLALAILPLALPLAALTGCGQSPQDHLAEARKAFAADDFATTRKAAIAGLEDEPKNAEMLLLLARSLLRTGDPEGADFAVERLKRLGRSGPEVGRFEAEIALQRGHPDEALAMLGSDNKTDAWRIRALARIRNDDLDGAIAAFEKGMAAGDDPYLLAEYARFRLEASDLAGARRIIARLQTVAPAGFETLMLSGQLAGKSLDHRSALESFRKAAKVQPGRFEPILAQAETLETLGKLGAAEKLLGQAAEIAPRAPAVRSLKLLILSQKGEWTKIRDMLQTQELSLDPMSADGMTYGEALLRLGHPEQARVLFRRTVLLSPDNHYARMMLAEAELASEAPDNAYYTLEPLFETLLVNPRELELAERAARAAGWEDDAAKLKQRRMSPQFAAQSRLAGQAEGAIAKGDWDAAVAAYRSLLAHGEDAEVLNRLAYACSKANLDAEAMAFADRALRIDPEHAKHLYMAGKVRLDAGRDLSAARELLEKASQADPRNTEISATLARAKAAAG